MASVAFVGQFSEPLSVSKTPNSVRTFLMSFRLRLPAECVTLSLCRPAAINSIQSHPGSKPTASLCRSSSSSAAVAKMAGLCKRSSNSIEQLNRYSVNSGSRRRSLIANSSFFRLFVPKTNGLDNIFLHSRLFCIC